MGPYVMAFAIPVICATFLLYVWMERKQTVRLQELMNARVQTARAMIALEEIEEEIHLQHQAGHPDLIYLEDMVLQRLRHIQETANRKDVG